MQGIGMHALQVLDAGTNDLCPASLEALSGTLEAGRLPQLAELFLNHNEYASIVFPL